jgi:antitoxin component YwqK of YwqJK toxin-antitoxin module
LLKKKPKIRSSRSISKTTYYFENGKVQQEGFFKMENLTELGFHMTRTEINHQLVTYDNGVKTGKWLFWNGKKT